MLKGILEDKADDLMWSWSKYHYVAWPLWGSWGLANW